MGDEWKAKLAWREGRQGRPVLRQIVANAQTILANDERWAAILGWDVFGDRLVTLHPPPWHDDDRPAHHAAGDWTDEDGTRAAAWLAREYALDLSARAVHEAAAVVARRRLVHPVRDWLRSLPPWDRTKRVDTWLTACAGVEDTPYSRAVGRMFLLGAVARVMVPGSKVDTVLVLEGEQGDLKSSLLRELAGGDRWFLETSAEIGTKDNLQNLARKWIVELAELSSLTQSGVERIKAFISNRVDTYRPSYGRLSVDHPRQCIFAGTTNANTYIKDATGGRRWNPVVCGRVDLGRLRDTRDQLWAEAVVLYDQGERWYVDDPTLARDFAVEQDARFQVDAWEPTIAEWLSSPGHPERRAVGVTVGDVLGGALGIDLGKWTKADEMRVGNVLRHLGWTPARHPVTRGGARVRPYRPKAVQPVQAVRSEARESTSTAQPAQPAQAYGPVYAHARAQQKVQEGGAVHVQAVQPDDDVEREAIQAEGGGAAQ